MEFKEYQEKAVKTAVYGAGNKITYPALGLANEVGEVLGKIKKCLRDNNGDFNDQWTAMIGDEIGDVYWYLAALCEDLRIDSQEVIQRNLIKLKDRQERGVIQGSGDNR